MIEIELKESGPTPKMMKREANAIHRGAAQEMGYYWHANFRAKHFTTAGATEYGYAARQGERGNIGRRGFKRSYTGRKLTRFGHTKPLVWSGDSEALSRIRDVRAVAKSGAAVGRVVIHASKLNFRPSGGKINMREEVTKISAGEAPILVGVAEKYLNEKYQAIRGGETTTIT